MEPSFSHIILMDHTTGEDNLNLILRGTVGYSMRETFLNLTQQWP